MNMVTIKCPKCSAEGKLSLVDTSYTGPRRCWKCHELFTITIVNNQVRSSEPLSEEEYNIQQAAKNAKDKMGKGIQVSKHDEPETPSFTPERRRDYTKPLSYETSPNREEPARQAPQSPPDNFRTFIPPSSPAEPEKPATKSAPEKFRPFIEPATLGEPKEPPKNPPDRIRTFIPPAT